MNQLTSKLLLAGAMTVAASMASAAQIEQSSPLSFSGGTSDFGAAFDASASGQTFLQSYTFNTPGTFEASSAVISSALGGTSSLDLTGLTLSGNGQTYDGVKSVVGGTQYYTISLSNLAAGNYVLAIAGTVTGSAGGSFGGNISVAAVPEASTVAMMLGGLGLVGFAAWRRRRAEGSSAAPTSAGAALMA